MLMPRDCHMYVNQFKRSLERPKVNLMMIIHDCLLVGQVFPDLDCVKEMFHGWEAAWSYDRLTDRMAL